MHDDEIEQRLRAAMTDDARHISPSRVADRLSVATLTASDDAQAAPVALMAAPHPTRWTGWRLAAPLAGGVAVVALAAALATFAGHGGGHHDANRGLAAAAGSTSTVPAMRSVAPAGGYLYVRASDPTETQQTWIPADRSQVWQFTNSNMNGAARNDRGRCAAFPHYEDTNGKVPGCDGGSWDFYRPAFADSLPNDPHAVLASLRTASNGPRDADVVDTASNFLVEGWVQPVAVAKIVAALKLIPGVKVTSTPEGQVTLAYSGRVKRTVRQFWSITVDSHDRVVGASSSYGDTKPLTETITYKQVAAIGDR
ncbi:hypothetical protein [uncultured Jatrophihabitans sp.]|uniref:hypothetical protein n=1 Tax=uncultured Jatrophihabitans sp. TaxID=1610747 RepID=UPI0035CCA926